jgi:hypothetical protein
MKYLRTLKVCTAIDALKNEDIRTEMGIVAAQKCIAK